MDVRRLISCAIAASRGIPCYSAEQRAAGKWVNLTEAAKLIGVSTLTVRRAIEQGKLQAQHPLPDRPWIISRDNLDANTIQRIAQEAAERCTAPGKPNPQQQKLDFSGT